MKAQRGVRALHACVLSLTQGVLEPPRTSDCTIVIVYGGLEFFLVRCAKPGFRVSELRELVFQLERAT